MWVIFLISGAGKLKLPDGVRPLTDQEQRWFSIGEGKNQTHESEFDGERAIGIQNNQKIKVTHSTCAQT